MTGAATKLDTQHILVEEVFPHAAETIWKTLTDGDLMGRWLMMQPKGYEAVPGNRFTYQTTPAGPWDGVIQCEVLEVRPNERLSYSWRGGHESNTDYGSRLDTIVTFTLTRLDGGTKLRVVHSGFITPKNDSAYKNMSGGWKKVIGRIGDISGEP